MFETHIVNNRFTGEILYSPINGWWIIKDSSDKKHRVASEQSWRIGETVAVVGGQIVGKAGYGKAARIYKV